MNQKTARLLKRSASASGKSAREVKKRWLSLSHKQRGPERQRIKAELA
ncbi:MAG: hypothetical protein ACT4QD_07000 [Acidobacteriota bacterium]